MNLVASWQSGHTRKFLNTRMVVPGGVLISPKVMASLSLWWHMALLSLLVGHRPQHDRRVGDESGGLHPLPEHGELGADLLDSRVSLVLDREDVPRPVHDQPALARSLSHASLVHVLSLEVPFLPLAGGSVDVGHQHARGRVPRCEFAKPRDGALGPGNVAVDATGPSSVRQVTSLGREMVTMNCSASSSRPARPRASTTQV